MADESGKIRVVIEGDSSSLQDEASKSKDALEGLGKMNESAGAGFLTWKKGAMAAGEGAKEFSFHGREAHRIAGEMNRVLPGSGEAFRALASGALSTVGPLMIAVMAAQAGVEWYGLLKDAANATAAANADAIKKIDEDSRAALQSWFDFQEALKGTQPSAAKKFQDEIRDRTAIMEAQAEVESKATGKPMRAVDMEQARNEIRRMVIPEVESDLAGRISSAKELKGQMIDREKYGLPTEDLKKELDKQTEAVKALTDELQTLRQTVATTDQVVSIKKVGEMAGLAKTDIDQATSMAHKGGGVSNDEAQYIMRVAQAASGVRYNLAQSEHYLAELEKLPDATRATIDRIGAALADHGRSWQEALDRLEKKIAALSRAQ